MKTQGESLLWYRHGFTCDYLGGGYLVLESVISYLVEVSLPFEPQLLFEPQVLFEPLDVQVWRYAPIRLGLLVTRQAPGRTLQGNWRSDIRQPQSVNAEERTTMGPLKMVFCRGTDVIIQL